MGAPVPKLEAAENASAEALLSSLKTITAKERRKHASVFNYWLSIRGNRQFPPIRDLDPLEISDAGPFSILLEMIGGGDDAVIRHTGQSVRGGIQVERISDAPNPSLLSCIYSKLPVVAACRQAYAFEETYEADGEKKRCWVTLLPFSATGTWVDFVYGFVSLDGETASGEEDLAVEGAEPQEEVEPLEEEKPGEEASEVAEAVSEAFVVPLRPLDEDPEPCEAVDEPVETAPAAVEELPEPEPELEPDADIPAVLDEALELEAEADLVPEPVDQAPEALDDVPEPEPETVDMLELDADGEPETTLELVPESQPSKPGFSAKLLEGLANLGGFYGQSVPLAPSSREPDASQQIEAEEPAEPEAIIEEEPVQPTCESEGTLQSKLNEVRAKAEEAREAQLRAKTALVEGLSAAYDFALDAEGQPEEYLRMVEAQGMKIQLRSPMKPVVKLGFDGMCDEATIAQLEAVLAWALKHDLPRGSLAEHIESEGGIERVLNG